MLIVFVIIIKWLCPMYILILSNIVGSPSKLTNPDGNLHTDGNKRYEYNGKENALLPPYLENGDQLANIRSSTLNKSSQNKPKRNPMITTPKRKGKENRLNQILLSGKN